MTLDEAIQHCHEKAEELRAEAEHERQYQDNKVKMFKAIKGLDEVEVDLSKMNDCLECANEHKQLAAWLTDYKRIKEGVIMSGRRSGKTAALIDFYLRPQGEWITDNGDKACPFCLTGTTGKDNASLPLFKFCPYCGARMSDPIKNETK